MKVDEKSVSVGVALGGTGGGEGGRERQGLMVGKVEERRDAANGGKGERWGRENTGWKMVGSKSMHLMGREREKWEKEREANERKGVKG